VADPHRCGDRDLPQPSTELILDPSDQVELLVLLNAMIPRPGETGSEWWSNTGQPEAMRAHLAALGLPPEAAEDDAAVYFHDVPPEVHAEALTRGEPEQSWTPMTQAWPLRAWPDVPTRVLIGSDDRLFPAEFQRRIVRERLGTDAEEVEGGHLVALSRPAELVKRIVSFVLSDATASSSEHGSRVPLLHGVRGLVSGRDMYTMSVSFQTGQEVSRRRGLRGRRNRWASIRGLFRDGSGDVTGGHARGVRDSRPHIGARELVPLTVLVLLLIGLLWVRKPSCAV
jgi:hypothetical protein